MVCARAVCMKNLSNIPGYAEIGITTNFSFLRGGSDPRAYVHQASELGIPAIGIADHNTLAGVVRAYKELENPEVTHKPKLLIGTRLVFIDGTPDILIYPRDRAAYGRLCQLLTRGKRGDDITRIEKGECHLRFDDLLEFAEGQLLVLALPHRFDEGSAQEILQRLKNSRADGVWLAASLLYRGDDKRRLARLHRLTLAAKVPLLATNEVLYHHPARRRLQDVLTCIREKTTIDAIGRRLEANADRYLKPPRERARLSRDLPEAIAETMRFAGRISFSLDQLKYQYPDEPVPPGKTAQQHLEDLTWVGVDKYFGGEISETLRATLRKELALIAELKYAHYFLTVHDIVHYARSQNILCQGRGSAANSAVCYVLGITSVDPTKVDLLFERFISKERLEPPDIDVVFKHSRREEVMQYVYRRYGRHRAAIIATVIHYRPRSAIRDVGKALGLTEDVTAALADTVWGSWGKGLNEMQVRQAGLDPQNAMIELAVALASELIEFPRHLSQHVGGYVLTQDRLDTYVPIGNAAMDDRTFIEWDKDDVDALNMMKVDVLALGMLTCIRKCFDLIDHHKGKRWELATVEQDDEKVYDMLCRGESLGVFQVESRAQMNMLPRLKPRTFYDLVIEVAIVRPGPIQGDMVHPYLRRRNGLEKVNYPSPSPEHGDKDELYRVLHKTLGVPLFQEQAMRIAIEAAKFTAEEANGLRRAMATFRNVGTIGKFEDKMIGNMIARGYAPDFARNCFEQIKGFGSYGFPESHAASFALLVYVSAWIKKHHPAAFAAALLNSQPMGFYAPAEIVRCAQGHQVPVLAPDAAFSHWDATLERGADGVLGLRLGLRQLDGFAQKDAAAIADNRGYGYRGFADFARRTGLPRRALVLLAEADALRGFGLDRREGLWAVRRLPDDAPLPLFAHGARAPEQGDERIAPLPLMPLSEHVLADYQTVRLSLKGYPTQFLRPRFAAEGMVSCAGVSEARDGSRIRCAGIVLVRQRPGEGNAIFITLSDETGICNVVVWTRVFDQFRREVMGARLLLVEGKVQKSPEGVVHLMAERLIDRSADLRLLSGEMPPPSRPAHRHPRDVRVLPPSRDFH